MKKAYERLTVAWKYQIFQAEAVKAKVQESYLYKSKAGKLRSDRWKLKNWQISLYVA